jgi:hypothetical protein
MIKYPGYSSNEWFERVDENTSTVMDKTRAPRLIQSQDDQRVLKNKTYFLLIDTTSGIIEKCTGAIVAPNPISWSVCVAEVMRSIGKLLIYL